MSPQMEGTFGPLRAVPLVSQVIARLLRGGSSALVGVRPVALNRANPPEGVRQTPQQTTSNDHE